MDPINPQSTDQPFINSSDPTVPQLTNEPINHSSGDRHWVTILSMALFVLMSLAVVGFLYYQNQQLKNMLASYQTPIGSPKPSAEAATADPTANWKTYTNVAGYSIKYPSSFTTQLIAVGAGNKEAISTTRNLFIFKSGTSEPYIERYINLEIFQGKPTYNQGTITEATLDNRTVEKIVIPDAKFDIYSAQVGDKGFIEIYVSNDPSKKEITDQILSTFKFLGTTNQSDIDTAKSLFESRYVAMGLDPAKVKINDIKLLGNYTDKYVVSYVPSIDYVGGGNYVLVGKQNGKWIMPESGDATYCGWVKNSGADEATIAFMGPTCK